MIFFARALARLVSFLLLVVLAVAGIALAVFSIDTGKSGLSLGWLASNLHFPAVRHAVGDWLGRLETGSSVAIIAALCGIGAILLGVLLLAGLLGPRRERLLELNSDGDGTLAARRRPLAQVAETLAEQARGVTAAKARVRPSRRGGGRLRVRASHPTKPDVAEVRGTVLGQVRELSDPFELKPDVEVARRGARVQ